MYRFLALLAAMALVHSGPLVAQQVADTAFHYAITHPAYAAGGGPVVAIDEAHHNFHTASERYLPFARLVERDGYVVRPWTEPFTTEGLRSVRVLVIANALAERHRVRDTTMDWSLPTPSAFTPFEADSSAHAQGLLVFGPGATMLLPDTAWVFRASTPKRPVAGWLQGAALSVAEGHVVIFGEAAMFSAQLAGARRAPWG